jgi:hypothetical protein
MMREREHIMMLIGTMASNDTMSNREGRVRDTLPHPCLLRPEPWVPPVMAGSERRTAPGIWVGRGSRDSAHAPGWPGRRDRVGRRDGRTGLGSGTGPGRGAAGPGWPWGGGTGLAVGRRDRVGRRDGGAGPRYGRGDRGFPNIAKLWKYSLPKWIGSVF